MDSMATELADFKTYIDVPEPYRTIGLAVLLAYGAPYLLKKIIGPFANVRKRLAEWFVGESARGVEERGVLYVYTFPRKWTRQMVNLSPYGVKLESWLRLKNIPHKVVQTSTFSKSTGQIPYIRYNGEEVADTHFIIRYISEKFDVDPLEGLTSEQRAATHAFHQMLDVNTALTYFVFRYKFLADEFLTLFQPSNRYLSKLITTQMGNGMLARASMSGMGRLTREQIGEIGKNDIRSVSTYLGTKKFLMGSEPTLVDCVVFAHLTHCLWVDISLPHRELLTECSNLQPYMERLKQRLWPDWHDIVLTDQFHQHTK